MRRCGPLLILALIGFLSPAQADVQVSGRLDHAGVVVGESTSLTITVEGAGGIEGDPSFEVPDGLRIRSAGESRNISVVNGQFSQSVDIRYTIVALRAGEYEVGPIEVEVEDRAYTVGPFKLTASESRPASGTSQRGPTGEQAQPASPPPVLVEMVVEPEEVFVGEQVILRVGFWQRSDLTVHDASFEPPETEGFWKEDLPPQRRSRRSRAGTSYEVSEILSALFPTRDGELTITPARVYVRYREPTRRRHDPFSPFGLSGRQMEAEPASRSCTVKVKPLPQPAPAGFTGAVGRFRISSQIDQSEIVQGEPLTWSVRVTGEGNVAAIEGPAFPEIPGCRSFDAGSEVQNTRQGDVLGGSKSFSRVLIPEAAGALDLPAVAWVYFDPKQQRYVAAEAEGGTVEVLPATAGADGSARRLGSAIRGIRTDGRLVPLQAERPWASVPFWLLQIVPVAALGIGFGWKRRRDEQEKDPAKVRLRTAPRRLRRALGGIEEEASDPWGRLARALESYLSDRYGPEVLGMTRESLVSHLSERGAEPEAASRISELLARADAQRYSPVETDRSEVSQAVREAADAAARLGRRGRRG